MLLPPTIDRQRASRMQQNGDTETVRSRKFALLLLTVVAVLNYIDRTILSILQIPIKTDLHLSDAQLGALTGLAFALFYSTCGIPIARVADRAPRRAVIAVAVIVWSGMTALTGLATSFTMLLLLRIGVAIGEAGSVPATHSLISDYFHRDERASALSLWGLSLPAGLTIGFMSAGWLATSVGWRAAFLWVGIAGIVLAPIIYFLLWEPKRGRTDVARQMQVETRSTAAAFRVLWSKRTLRPLWLAGALNAYTQLSMSSWNAPFYARVHHVPLATLSVYLALLNGIGGGIGLFLGGFLSDRLGRRNPRLFLMVPAVGILTVIPFALLQYFAGSTTVSLVAAIVPSACVLFYFSPIIAASHSLIPPSMRAFTSAMLVLIVNLIGMGLGPLVTGAISDYLSRHHGMGNESLRYAISSSMIVALAAGVLFWRASVLHARELSMPMTR